MLFFFQLTIYSEGVLNMASPMSPSDKYTEIGKCSAFFLKNPDKVSTCDDCHIQDDKDAINYLYNATDDSDVEVTPYYSSDNTSLGYSNL